MTRCGFPGRVLTLPPGRLLQLCVHVLTRKGADLVYKARISLINALQGFERKLTLLNGTRVAVVHDEVTLPVVLFAIVARGGGGGGQGPRGEERARESKNERDVEIKVRLGQPYSTTYHTALYFLTSAWFPVNSR